MSRVISHQDYPLIHKLLDQNEEVCGFLLPTNTPFLKLYVDSVGSRASYGMGKTRGACQHSRYTRYIFHTHPYIDIAYPSSQDIIKMLKSRPQKYPISSVIFTKWGIWEISADQRKIFNQKAVDAFNDLITSISKPLYNATDRGRGDLSDRAEIKALNKYMSKLVKTIKTKRIKLKIALTPWSELEGKNYQLKFRDYK